MIDLQEELNKFQASPIAWSHEWIEKNGKIEMGEHLVLNRNNETERMFYVTLHVNDVTVRPMGTGVHKTLALAFINAIKAVNTTAGILAGF